MQGLQTAHQGSSASCLSLDTLSSTRIRRLSLWAARPACVAQIPACSHCQPLLRALPSHRGQPTAATHPRATSASPTGNHQNTAHTVLRRALSAQMWAHGHWRPKHRHPFHTAVNGINDSADNVPRSTAVAELAQDVDELTEELRSGPFGEAGLESRKQLCNSGLPEVEMCELDEPPPSIPAVQEALSRGKWLLGLLILQSTSSFVLDAYSELLRDHLVVVMFLTMLVGAGGNAGNQSAIKVIRGLATGSMLPSWQSARNTLVQQASVGLMLGTGLSAGGFIRVYLWNGSIINAAAISVSLFAIVMSSVVLGTGLPFALTRLGVDPANAGTSIQVLMDILGVAITCVTCHIVLDQLAAGMTM